MADEPDSSGIFERPMGRRRRVFLGDVELLREIARGSMGKVFLAHQRTLDRFVAVKFLAAALAKDEALVQRFVNEARATAAVQHPNVVAVYGGGEVKGRPYLIMELLEGKSLQEVAEGGPLSVALALSYLRQASLGLQAAWEHGLVHRDVNPRNLMLSKDGVLKVTDFGLAKRVNMPSGVKTSSDVILGTPHFMSPEHAQGKSQDCRSDIYSLGATFYFLLSGVHPFEGDTPMQILVNHVEAPLPPLQPRRPELPLALCATVERMLRKNPDERFPSYDELLQRVAALAAGTARDGTTTSPGKAVVGASS